MVYENLGVTAIRSYCIGVVLGGIYEWKKKVALAIVGISVIFILLLFIFEPAETSEFYSSNWSGWNWLIMFIAVNIGGFCGGALISEFKK